MADDLRVQIFAIPQNNPTQPIEEQITLPDTGRHGQIDTAQERDLLETALNRLRALYPTSRYHFSVNGNPLSSLSNSRAVINAFHHTPTHLAAFTSLNFTFMGTQPQGILSQDIHMGLAHGPFRVALGGFIAGRISPSSENNDLIISDVLLGASIMVGISSRNTQDSVGHGPFGDIPRQRPRNLTFGLQTTVRVGDDLVSTLSIHQPYVSLSQTVTVGSRTNFFQIGPNLSWTPRDGVQLGLQIGWALGNF